MQQSPIADLHVHTTASDGTMTLSELPAIAREAGVDVVAVTDHDRFHPDLDGPVVERAGVTLIRGIELRVDAGDQRVDLLGFGVRETDALTETVAAIQRDRIERGRRIVDCVEDRLGVDLGINPAEGLGRPHIARAIAATDAPYDFDGAFEDLIGDGRPCYVARDIPTFDEGVATLRAACDLVALAHPFRYPDADAALELATDLDGVERWYPYDGSRGHDATGGDGARLDELAERRDLVRTGGSDAHGRTLGRAGPSDEAFERFADELGFGVASQ